MRRPFAVALVAGLLAASAVTAHASSRTIDAGTLQTQSIAVEFTPPASTEEDCKNNGWTHWVDDRGREFRNQGGCQSYVAGGGTLYPKAPGVGTAGAPLAVVSNDDHGQSPSGPATEEPEVTAAADGQTLWSDDLAAMAGDRCLDGRWQTMREATSTPYASEAACIEGEQAAYASRATTP